MKRKSIQLIAMASLVAVAAVCLALSWPGPASAATPVAAVPTAQTRTVTAQGSGIVTVKPDMATLSVGATARNKSAKTAQTEVNKVAEAMIKAAKASGLKDSDMLTSGVSLRPTYDYSGNTSKLNGYEAIYTLTLKVSDIGKVGEVLDAQIDAGANTNGNVSFSLKNDEAAYKKALESAVADAKTKAETLAKATGGKLGDALTVTEGSQGYYTPYRSSAASATMDAAGGTPIMAEAIEISTSVSITYELLK